ncbi:MAG: chromosome segregation protein SMC [Thermoleophilia bacterium]
MLSRLEVRGFKSFATSTALDFGPGLNVIVGPNGSGKSNLAEALVWAMGEQRATRLRASGMSEVVFSGGDGRAPAGLAEVSMTLTRAEATTDDAAELGVTRRVTRAGDATYRLNGVSCRLLDIHESLATRGLGPDALAVIRQGQVEAVCTSRPADLRAVIEEAAGVALQKRRRKRAEQKLARVADRLDRARDLATELHERRESLKTQAEQAERAETLDREIAAGHARIAAASAIAAHRAVRAARERLASAQAAAEHQESQLALARTALDEADAAVARAEQRRESRRDLARHVRAAADRVHNRADLAAERVAAAERQHAREARERDAALASRDDAERAANEAGMRRGRAESAVSDAEARVATTAAAAAETRDAVLEATTRHHDAVQTQEEARRALGAVERQGVEVAEALEAARARIDAVTVEAGAGDLARAERRAEISGQRSQHWSDRVEAATRVLDDARSERTAADAYRRECAAEVSRSGKTRDLVTGVGEHITVVPGAERAVGAALGVAAESSTAASHVAAADLIDRGAAAVLVDGPADGGCEAPVAGATRILDLVTITRDDLVGPVTRVLQDAWLVESFDAVPADTAAICVTSDGRRFRPSQGILTQPRSEWTAGALRAAAEERLSEAEAALEGLEQRETALRGAAAAVERRFRAARRCHDRAEAELASIRAANARLAGERADAEAARDAAQAAVVTVRDELPRLTAALESAAADCALALAALEEREAAAAAARAAHSETDAALVAARAELAAAQIADAEAAERLANIQRRALTAPGVQDLELPRRAVDALNAVAASLVDEARLVAEEATSAGEDLAEAQRARAEVRQRLVDAEVARDTARKTAHDAELRCTDAAARADELGPEPDEQSDQRSETPVDPAAERRRVADLERRRAELGAVNSLAATEHAEMDERILEIEEQITDLDETAAALAGHMEGLDTIVSDGFGDLFAAVQQRFSENIGTLFPGGQGRLAEVEDGEDAGIELQVVPAGKRARPLSMLSGGERSLVALAFCMAIAMTQPAPFYLLDEVEAALDDSNLRRFLALVRKLSSHTQFLMITHQQPTVEIADTLFGVTMGGDGVSQVVSRRLDHALDGSSRPFVRRQLKAIAGGRA